MFGRLGRIVVRRRILIVCIWAALAAAMLFAPSLQTVGTADETSFLPLGTESSAARDLAARDFPDGSMDSAGVVVFFNPGGLTETDRDYARGVADWLARSGPREVSQVVSVFAHPELSDLLVSRDGRTMLLQVSFNVAPFHGPANQAVAAIRGHLVDAPAGLEVRFTGEAGIGADFLAAVDRGTDRATLVTLALAVIVVLLVYRSPVAALVPLTTVGVAFLTSRGILGLLAAAGFNVSSLLESFLVVLTFGVGTDYSLFIISRYREELSRGDRVSAAVETVRRMGPVIVSGAATVVIGLLSLGIAQYRLTKTIGPAMGLAVAVTLAASLTLTPALFSLFGRRLFWPHAEPAGAPSRQGFWHRLADVVTARPAVVSLAALALLALPLVRLPSMVSSFNLLDELSAATDSVRGFTIITDHFDEGDMTPISVLVRAPFDLTEAGGLAMTRRLADALGSVPGVERIVAVTSPASDLASGNRLTVAGQLSEIISGPEAGLAAPPASPAQGPSATLGGLSFDPDILTSAGTDARLNAMRSYLDDLGRSFPELGDDPAYRSATDALAELGAALADARREARPDFQLRQMAGAFEGMAMATTAQPDSPAGTSTGWLSADLAAAFGQLEMIPRYLSELAAQYPAVRDLPAFEAATTALAELDGVRQSLRVDGQLLLMATQLRSSSAALADGPSGGFPTTAVGGGSATDFDGNDPFAALSGHLNGLAKAYPELTQDPDYRSALTTIDGLRATLDGLGAAGRVYSFEAPLAFLSPAAWQRVTADRDRIVGAPAAIAADLERLAGLVESLAATFSARPDAFYVPPGVGVAGNPAAINVTALPGRLATDFESLADALSADDGGPFLPVSLMNTPVGKAMAEAFGAQVAALKDGLEGLRADFAGRGPVYFLPQSLIGQEEAQSILSLFYSTDRRTLRVLAVADGDPYSPAAFRAVSGLRRVLRTEMVTEGWGGAKAYVGGPTAEFTDISRLVGRDFRAILLTVVVGVFVVMAILLRSLVAPAYLVLSVLLSYGTALGLGTLVFQDLLGHPGVNYVIPIIVLVLLVALGADYNIFLMSRVREEAGSGPVKPGVSRAAGVTGGVITACGLILAGSFAALTAAPMRLLFQVGATVAMGVLVDTFLIRAVLIPALAAALGRWNWWPARGR